MVTGILGSKVFAIVTCQDLSDIVTSDVDLLGKTLASLCPWSKVFVVKLGLQQISGRQQESLWKDQAMEMYGNFHLTRFLVGKTGVIKCHPFWGRDES